MNDDASKANLLIALHGDPWAIRQDRMRAMLNTWIVGQGSQEEIENKTGPRKVDFFSLEGKWLGHAKGGLHAIDEMLAASKSERPMIAVVPISGPISYKASMWTAYFGGTSLERFGQLIERLVNDPKIGGVVYDVDSPGGVVTGLPEASESLYKSRRKLPSVAVANSDMASAAYYLATAAGSVSVIPSGEVGSVGVWSAHADYSKMLEIEGIKVTFASAGDHKIEFNPYESLSEDALAEMQRGVDLWYDKFLSALERHRGVSRAKIKRDYGQGRMLEAERALDAGLVDRIETLDQAIKRLGSEIGGKVVAREEAASRQRAIETLGVG